MRRKRNNGTWFPNLGTRPADAYALSARFIEIAIDANPRHTSTGVIPLTFDYPQEGEDLDSETDTLSEIVGSEYFINRIVGKLHAAYTYNDVAANPPPALLVGAGLFVARAGSAESSGADVPIGLSADREKDYGPLSFNAIRQPWMWRRTWILGAGGPVWGVGATAGSSGTPFSTVQGEASPSWALFPSTTAGYMGIQDGPHFDVKSHRVVGLDERLWLSISARALPLSISSLGSGTDPSVLVHFDYRILGKLRKARVRGSF